MVQRKKRPALTHIHRSSIKAAGEKLGYWEFKKQHSCLLPPPQRACLLPQAQRRCLGPPQRLTDALSQPRDIPRAHQA